MIIAVACNTLAQFFLCFAPDLVKVLFSGFVQKGTKIRQSNIILLSSIASKLLFEH